MKKIILITLLIFCFTLQSFAGISLDIEVDEDENVLIEGESSYEKAPIAIKIYDKDKKYYIDQDTTDEDGGFKFNFRVYEDKEYDGKISIEGKKKKFSFSTKKEEDFAYIYIKGYEGTIMSKTKVIIKENDTVLDVLERILDNKDIEYKIENGYVKSIDEQSEFDKGAKSGWMFSVNGEFPEIGAESVEVDKGDYVKWIYTIDLGEDIGASNPDIQDEIDALNISEISEEEILKALDRIIDILEDSFDKVEDAEDAKDLIDYVSDTIEIMGKSTKKIESDKNRKEIVDISLRLLKFLIKASHKIEKEEINKVKEAASKTAAIVLKVTDKIEDKKIGKNNFENIVDYIAKLNDILGEERTLSIDISFEEKDEIQISFPEGSLHNIFESNIEKIKIRTKLEVFNIEYNTFNKKIMDKKVLFKIANITNVENVSENNVDLERGFDIISDGEKIKTFNRPIEICFLYNNIKNNRNIIVSLLKEDGESETIFGEYDADNQYVKFRTSYPCKYIVNLSTNKFTDLNNYKWALDSVEIMTSKGIIYGRTDREFDPSANITRAEFAALITRMLDCDNNNYSKIPFKDVDKGSWFYTAVASAYEMGLINGRTQDAFDPQGKITREEIANIVSKVLEIEKKYSNADKYEQIDQFVDKGDIAPWAKAPVEYVLKKGIIKGMENGRFAPKEKANRAQAVVILYRLYKLVYVN